jgi:hypothetical protein
MIMQPTVIVCILHSLVPRCLNRYLQTIHHAPNAIQIRKILQNNFLIMLNFCRRRKRNLCVLLRSQNLSECGRCRRCRKARPWRRRIVVSGWKCCRETASRSGRGWMRIVEGCWLRWWRRVSTNGDGSMSREECLAERGVGANG